MKGVRIFGDGTDTIDESELNFYLSALHYLGFENVGIEIKKRFNAPLNATIYKIKVNYANDIENDRLDKMIEIREIKRRIDTAFDESNTIDEFDEKCKSIYEKQSCVDLTEFKFLCSNVF